MTKAPKKLPWFRLWSEMRHNPKVLKLSFADRWYWLVLLCVANEQTPRGSLPATADLALELRISPGKAASLLTRLRDAGLVESGPDGGPAIHDWRQWQRESDDAASRMARARAESSEDVRNKFGTSDEQPPNDARTSSAPEEEEETELEAESEPDRETTLPEADQPPDIAAEAENGSPVERVRRRLRDCGITSPGEAELETAIDESGVECVMHCIDEALRYNKPSLAYVESVRRRHVEDGCPRSGRTRSERLAEQSRRQ